MMPFTAHDPRLFYDAIVAQIASSTGKTVGLAEAPTNNTLPYAIVYPLADESSEGALSNPTQILTWAWQVTAVSNKAEAVQWMQHKVRVALHGFTPTVAGLGTTPIEMVDGSGVTRDDGVQPPLFYTTDRFTAYTSI